MQNQRFLDLIRVATGARLVFKKIVESQNFPNLPQQVTTFLPQSSSHARSHLVEEKEGHSPRRLTSKELARREQQALLVRRAAKQKELASRQNTQQLSVSARQKRVPSSQLGRFLGFGGLATSVGFGLLSDKVRGNANKDMMSEDVAERLAAGLCRMRGAALKVGQMISIQGEEFLPETLSKALDRVRASADVMPPKQLKKALNRGLGSDWREKLVSFDDQPFAAASIGQVHRGILHPETAAKYFDSSNEKREVAIKVQYPGVADSIDSDLNNLSALLKWFGLFPDGMYLENAMRVARSELKLETNYENERSNQRRFEEMIADDPVFYVPKVIEELSSSSVLTTEMVYGVPIDKSAKVLSESERDLVSSKIFELCIRELFEFRFMQTDPNYSNFFYDPELEQINLIDFGSCRNFDKDFSRLYLDVVYAALNKDRQTVLDRSIQLGFLTGKETRAMLDAHVDAVVILGEPFSAKNGFDFSAQNLTSRIHSLIPDMVANRLTPPPDESYSLHRKLSGAFLICAKLKATVNCNRLFLDVRDKVLSNERTNK
mmetsp:Transcript_4022/g.6029  ORF Transcript_4022/g.6029 Transcript_4022/m.6029 type:complete len:548 (-) Transcript_4022:13-1656(-)|eukprot:CAMPEP_0201550424 /NCGR_PEP_ID=MMETSP0173_2-20130828/6781_1 /ASSEMBLY_ACC=CAM_ASM_000268 /TAXON_ID=218659 /ORGANISM="Vexillifera sp., Strain DIVA3 564/2" /LENGTH=547 /DNA_ID=CAMNT_0047960385 /DNA_START=16 /DNA_END=1659 /DNA_ORIENTATION=+